MKKIIYLILFILIFAGLVGVVVFQNSSVASDATKNESSSKANEKEDDVIEIKDKMFMTQVNDIYINMKNYKGKKIKLEGFIYKIQDFDFIMRRTPGCCGNDGIIGLEIKWNGEIPNADAWVSAQGVLEILDEGYGEQPVLNLTFLEEKQERGIEFVYQ